MKYDVILAGVGGQGIVSIAFVLDNVALKNGWHFKQAEVHGMAQRGGAVFSHLRMSEEPVHSDLTPAGSADMILAVEPVEALRYLNYLNRDGIVVASSTPYVNIPDYPDREVVLENLLLVPRRVILPSEALARHAGSARAQNTVMIGAASWYLPFAPEDLQQFIGVLFGAKGEKIVNTNLRAFEIGRAAAANFRMLLEAGLDPRTVVALCEQLEPQELPESDLRALADRMLDDRVLLERIAEKKGFLSAKELLGV
jgi:indolepyruvate ferredoxin oxidoreductase, beta subunit